MAWIEKRKTKYEEDKAYSVFGIFNDRRGMVVLAFSVWHVGRSPWRVAILFLPRSLEGFKADCHYFLYVTLRKWDKNREDDIRFSGIPFFSDIIGTVRLNRGYSLVQILPFEWAQARLWRAIGEFRSAWHSHRLNANTLECSHG